MKTGRDMMQGLVQPRTASPSAEENKRTIASRSSDVLVVVSVPFARNPRFLLSSMAFERLRDRFPLLIVSPFAEDVEFQREFGGGKVSFLKMATQPQPALSAWLFQKSETLRFIGYWFRFRHSGTDLYWREYAGRGWRSPLRWLAGICAARPAAWRFLDRCFGHLMFDTGALNRAAAGYRQVVSIQTANWGYQERLIAFNSRTRGFPTVLVPYTTDQLTVNGFLIADFAAICAQGTLETTRAVVHHNVSPARVVPLGMIWFRNIDRARERGAVGFERGERRQILYAGVASEYFSKSSEIAAIRAILEAADDRRLPAVQIIYRPILSQGEEELLRQQLMHFRNVEIQLPDLSLFGISNFGGGPVGPQIDEYVQQLIGMDVFVMSVTTSMALDAMYLDIPTISNFADIEVPFDARVAHPRLRSDLVGVLDTGIPVALTVDQLVADVADALVTPQWHASARASILHKWDYADCDYAESIQHLVEALSSPPK